MTDPSVAVLTLSVLQVLVGVGVVALLVGIVAVGTLVTPPPAEKTRRVRESRPAPALPATAH